MCDKARRLRSWLRPPPRRPDRWQTGPGGCIIPRDQPCGVSMDELRDHFRRLSSLLRAKSDLASSMQHHGILGTVREAVVRDFLRPHLPRVFEITSGEVIDSRGSVSPQQDVIIADSSLPFIDVGAPGYARLLAESVVATVEVKSDLDKGELMRALRNIESVKGLHRQGTQTYHKGNALIQMEARPILSYVFAFDGLGGGKITEHLESFAKGKEDGTERPGSRLPDAIVVLERCVVARTSEIPRVSGATVKLPPAAQHSYSILPYSRDVLFSFFGRLVQDLLPLRMTSVDLDSYLRGSQLE